MDAFTRCEVCEMSPAETLYDGSPMCYDCRAATAKVKAEMANAPKEPCIGCGAEVCEKCGKLDQPHDPCDCVECIQCGALNCEDIMCRYPDMGQSDSEDESDRAAIEDYEDGMTDMEADADTLRSCGWGTDEDYGYFGEE